jgi:hypothetical protein
MANKKTKEAKEAEIRKQTEIFDLSKENFKKIFTDKGVNRDELLEFTINTLRLMSDEENQSGFAQSLIFQIMNQCSFNAYEALGILEATKYEYIKTLEEIYEQEMQEDDDD